MRFIGHSAKGVCAIELSLIDEFDVHCRHALDMAPVNLDRVQSWIDQGRLDPSKTITVKELAESRCIHGVKDGVKLLAKVRWSMVSLAVGGLLRVS